MIKVLITFDYELPLGKADSYSKAMFEPTEAILDVGREIGIPFVFFSDVCCALQFKKWNKERFYYPFKKQVQKSILEGHDVQLHIHPHWITSKYENNKFIPSMDFSLGDFPNKRSNLTIKEIIQSGKEELELICKEVDPNYQCISYRAGGYSILKKEQEVLEGLELNGIKIDSSVIPNFIKKASIFDINFSQAPKHTDWFADPKQGLLKAASRGIWEIPISSMPIGLFYILKRRLKKQFKKAEIVQRKFQNMGKGFPLTKVALSRKEMIQDLLNPVRLTFDNDHLELNDLMQIFDYNVSSWRGSGDIFITSISHPKIMGSYHIELMKKFILKVKEKYQKEVSFITYQNLV
tara:strand:+ start:654 stop:1703 length:1050 start_codon:yes stop_codon:yes gene_type:complete